MLLPLILLLAAPQDHDASEAMANYKVLTAADVPCKRPADDTEIVVCARRDADKYRVPLVIRGSARDSVPLRTADLTKDYSRLPCGQGAFIAQCGPGFGVGVTIGFDGKAHVEERQLAP
jgi:hypothetical protein